MLTVRQNLQLGRIVARLRKLLAELEHEQRLASGKGRVAASAHRLGGVKRTRRSAPQVAQMRKEILSARKRGVAVTELASKFGVSTAYIYMLK